MKYTVKAVRRETYVVAFEVEADSIAEAEAKAIEVVNEGDSDFFGEANYGDEWIHSVERVEIE